jgi:hypothetical protein
MPIIDRHEVPALPSASRSGEAIRIADIVLGGFDLNGLTVECVYSKRPQYYVVYKAGARVMVQCSDDPELADVQRARLASLTGMRTEIDWLLNSWRSSPSERLRELAGRYDRRVADAMTVALEGEVRAAATLLAQIRTDLTDQKAFRGRLLSLGFAAGAVAILGLLAGVAIATSLDIVLGARSPLATSLVVAMIAGSLGAFFSIGTRPRDRSLGAEAGTRESAADSSVRILIGAMSAVCLLLILDTGLISIRIGDLTFGAVQGAGEGAVEPGARFWLSTTIPAFLAGFTERLVPGLLGAAPGSSRRGGETFEAGGLPAVDPAEALREIKRAVQSATLAALSGPELTRFHGYVKVGVTWVDEGMAHRRALLNVRFLQEPVDGACEINISDGVVAPEAEFVVECEPEGSPRNLVARTLTVPTDRSFHTDPIAIDVPLGTPRLWVQIFQHNRLLQTVPVEIGDHARIAPADEE